MDRMKLMNLLNKEKVILKYNNKDYIIYYRPIINCIKNILSINYIHKYMTFNFKYDQVINFNYIIYRLLFSNIIYRFIVK